MLHGSTPAEIAAELATLGLPPFRARQVCRWMYQKDVQDFARMTDLGKELRATLAERYAPLPQRIAHVDGARDGSRKYAIALEDGSSIESVLIVGGKRPSICLSSQVGCAMACTFCRTGEMGLLRQLTAGEILSQVSLVRAEAGLTREPLSYVFMGMGEPLHNAGAVVRALSVMTDPDGMAISPRRITVSTAGFLPGLEELAASGIKVKLAVSLAAPTDPLRDQLVPLNRRFPMDDVLRAVRAVGRRRGDRITIAYVLLAGVNDAPEDARSLADRLAPHPVKVNLIPFNPYPGSPYRRPADDVARRFQEVLLGRGIACSVRATHAEDVLAACGQLATR